MSDWKDKLLNSDLPKQMKEFGPWAVFSDGTVTIDEEVAPMTPDEAATLASDLEKAATYARKFIKNGGTMVQDKS